MTRSESGEFDAVPAQLAGSVSAWPSLSAATFGTSGAFAKSLIDAGWSPAAAVTARVSIAALVLAIPGAVVMRGRWHLLRRDAVMIAAYGTCSPWRAAQLFYFNAVQHLSVGVALMLEYLGTILVVGWMWARHGHRPRRLTLIGAAAALAGLVLILELSGSSHLDLVGVLWGLGAAVGLAVYFVLSVPEPAMTCRRSRWPAAAWASGRSPCWPWAAWACCPMHATFGLVDFAGRTSAG